MASMNERIHDWTPDESACPQTRANSRSLRIRRIGGCRSGSWWWWIVCSCGHWHRRTTGSYGRAVESRHAFVRVSGNPTEVVVTAAGARDAISVDAAYRTKYGAGGAASMVTAEAAASTLVLTPAIGNG